MRALLVTSLLLLLAGCGEAKLDSGSEESFKSSLSKINAELSDEKKALLDKALTSIAFKSIMAGQAGPDSGIAGFRKRVDGKTAEEVIEMAEAKK